MSTICKRIGTYAVAAIAIPLISITAQTGYAKEFTPGKTATVIVTSSPGGGSDTVTRTLTDIIRENKLTDTNFVIENRTGGSGAVGYSYVTQHGGDENMWANIGVSFFTTPLLGNSPVNYKDFTPLAAVAEDAYVMAVAANSEITGLDSIAKSGRMLSGTTGIVADPALIAHRLEESMGIEVDIVPFEGDGEVTAALLGGHIDVQFGNPSEILPLIQGGEMRAIAVSSDERLEALPDVPTMKEQGYDVSLTQLRGFVMPPKVSAEAAAYWADIIGKALKSPQWKERYIDRYNVVPKFLSGQEFAAEMDRRNTDYTALMKKLGLLK
ncbi:tripartite tricarboxylate transporter substrate binding protein [uncultured Cohaesibacter sp.]|uniref:Bug family tripartite tricarboxylate transporter substrate binding protein n=1 Tax=uncultured Cohaesibacter sp. TaxID=1002546 RepID=UPI00292F1713|nr:tripartite tricarboxylate transporter substrate binding protein [uncultured Cohaesibacter sp.]